MSTVELRDLCKEINVLCKQFIVLEHGNRQQLLVRLGSPPPPSDSPLPMMRGREQTGVEGGRRRCIRSGGWLLALMCGSNLKKGLGPSALPIGNARAAPSAATLLHTSPWTRAQDATVVLVAVTRASHRCRCVHTHGSGSEDSPGTAIISARLCA